MSQRGLRNRQREEENLLKTRAGLVRSALDRGFMSRSEICRVTGMKLHELSNLFTNDRKLFGEYCIIRKTIADVASDNILDIVNDKTHPKNYEASKYILSSYKSDFDEALESHDGESPSVTIGGESKASPIVIKFGKGK